MFLLLRIVRKIIESLLVLADLVRFCECWEALENIHLGGSLCLLVAPCAKTRTLLSAKGVEDCWRLCYIKINEASCLSPPLYAYRRCPTLLQTFSTPIHGHIRRSKLNANQIDFRKQDQALRSLSYAGAGTDWSTIYEGRTPEPFDYQIPAIANCATNWWDMWK